MSSELGNARSMGNQGRRRWRGAVAMLLAGLLLLAWVLVDKAPAAPGDDQVVYSTDFDQGPGPEWSLQDDETSDEGERFLGLLSNDNATLRVNGMPKHERLLVELDMYIIDSMDGNDTGPGSSEEETGVPNPDIFTYRANGKLIKKTTFSNTHPQAFPGDYPGGEYDAKTGSSAEDTLGYDEDTTFPVSLSFLHSGKKVQFSTRASGLDDIDDESWGIDNVEVTAQRDCKVLKKKLRKAKRKVKRTEKKLKRAKVKGSAKKVKKVKKKLRKAKRKKRKAKRTYREVCR
jgi:hypothetical protein